MYISIPKIFIYFAEEKWKKKKKIAKDKFA